MLILPRLLKEQQFSILKDFLFNKSTCNINGFFVKKEIMFAKVANIISLCLSRTLKITQCETLNYNFAYWSINLIISHTDDTRIESEVDIVNA